MIRFIALDSGPLGLLAQRPGAVEADACRKWLGVKTSTGIRVLVPEIVDYELRRELLRAGKTTSIARLDGILAYPVVDILLITSAALRRAAELWAKARQQGKPTADPHALDVDVILAAQLLASGFDPSEFVVATSNISHLSQFVPAELWSRI